ncbi:MAG: hypothetical protein MUF87_19865 [Anaerolineae bacterium]|nr:hypothetical protein [Anaerolineae bacterium]
MPADIERLQPGLYLLRWYGEVTFEQIANSQRIGLQYVAQDQVKNYILVADISAATKVPNDLRRYQSLFREDQTQYIHIVGANRAMAFAANTIRRFTGRLNHMRFYQTLDEALDEARQLLQIESPSSP